MWFLFCLIWGIGGTLDEDGRKKFDTFMREKDARYPRPACRGQGRHVCTTYHHYFFSCDGCQEGVSMTKWLKKLAHTCGADLRLLYQPYMRQLNVYIACSVRPFGAL
eukprot:1157259-Pelagomonas_calceolata.AAC.14